MCALASLATHGAPLAHPTRTPTDPLTAAGRAAVGSVCAPSGSRPPAVRLRGDARVASLFLRFTRLHLWEGVAPAQCSLLQVRPCEPTRRKWRSPASFPSGKHGSHCPRAPRSGPGSCRASRPPPSSAHLWRARRPRRSRRQRASSGRRHHLPTPAIGPHTHRQHRPKRRLDVPVAHRSPCVITTASGAPASYRGKGSKHARSARGPSQRCRTPEAPQYRDAGTGAPSVPGSLVQLAGPLIRGPTAAAAPLSTRARPKDTHSRP